MTQNPNDAPNTNRRDTSDELAVGNIASVGFSNPGSPGDEMGMPPMPESGDVGAADPAGDVDVGGGDQRDQGADALTRDGV